MGALGKAFDLFVLPFRRPPPSAVAGIVSNPGRQTDARAPLIAVQGLAKFVRARSIERALKTLNIFVTELQQKGVSLRSIIRAKDVDGLKMLAHSMLGSGMFLGADRLVEHGRAIEKSCNGDGPVDWLAAVEFQSVVTETFAAYAAVTFDKEALLRLLSEHDIVV